MLVGGQERVNKAKETPKGSSMKHNLGEVIEVGIENSGKVIWVKAHGEVRSENEGR